MVLLNFRLYREILIIHECNDVFDVTYKKCDVIKSSQTKEAQNDYCENDENQYEHNKIRCLQENL